MKLKKIFLGALIGFSCISSFAQEKKQDNDWVVGLHLGSYHDRGNLNDFNPGVYIRKNNFVAGGYYNSVKKNSFYLGYMLETETPNLPVVDSVGILVGGITGYKKDIEIAGFTPVAIPSARFDLTEDFSMRLAFVPKTSMTKANVVHFSVEKSF